MGDGVFSRGGEVPLAPSLLFGYEYRNGNFELGVWELGTEYVRGMSGAWGA